MVSAGKRTVIVLAVGLALGYVIGRIDASPGWDDAGISAALLLGVSGALGFAAPRHAWLVALAVGAWIPAFGILGSGNYGSLLALGFGFVGACAGALGRRAVSGGMRAAR